MIITAAYGALALFGAKQVYNGFAGGVVADPVPGAILYSPIVTGIAEHSGVYIGDGRIVHLNGDGDIEAVSAWTFLNRLGGLSTGLSIFVSCDENGPVGSQEVADRAESMIGERRDYGFLMDNCHQFSSGCLTAAFENPHNFLWMLKDEAGRTLGATRWASWIFDRKREENRFSSAPHLKRMIATMATVNARLDQLADGRIVLEQQLAPGATSAALEEVLQHESKLQARRVQLQDYVTRMKQGKLRVTESSRAGE